jgi:hypothetical protein
MIIMAGILLAFGNITSLSQVFEQKHTVLVMNCGCTCFNCKHPWFMSYLKCSKGIGISLSDVC